MSQTFHHKGRRVDFDLWMHPDLAQDLDFDILASMVTGTHQNVATFEQDVVQERFHHVEQSPNFQFAVGAALAAWGTVMLIPGPAHLVAARVGWSIGGPIGAGIAVVAYVVFGLIVLGTGVVLMATA
jgi:hypothetical protein